VNKPNEKDQVMSTDLLSFETPTGWEILNLLDLSKIDAIITDTSDRVIKDGLQNIDCGADDLCVLHFPLSGDTGTLEFLNQLIAKRYELPTRVVTVKYRQARKALVKSLSKGSIGGAEPLNPVTVSRHDVIPRDEWLRFKAIAERKESQAVS
jgi:hypothetical protein